MVYRILLICVFLQQATYKTAAKCVDPKITISYVNSCPESFTSWLKAAERKNCSAYEKTCGENKPVKYHCVMNTYRNATLEICAAEMSIVGHYCPEYNEYGNLIQEHYGTVCKSCPFYYYSTDVYKYPDCFQYQNTKENSSSLTTDNDHITSVGSTSMQHAFKSTSPMYITASTTTRTTTTAAATETATTTINQRISAISVTAIVLGSIFVLALVFMLALRLRKGGWLCKEKMLKFIPISRTEP